jgi:hypothetical protein
LAFDFTAAGMVFAAAFVTIGTTKALLWRLIRKDARDAAGRRVLLQFALTDAFLKSVYFGLIMGAPYLGLWWVAAICVVGASQHLFVERRLERWRDARVSACNAAHEAATVGAP